MSDQTAGCKCYGCVTLVPNMRRRAERAEAEVARLRGAKDRLETAYAREFAALERWRLAGTGLRELAKRARSVAAAPEYDDDAIRDALWALVDAAALTLGEAG